MRRDSKSGWLPQIPQSTPKPGDVLISRLAVPRGGHALCVVPNPLQIAHGTYDEALAHAKRFAQTQRVDVWVVDGKEGYALVARHRAGKEQARS